MSQVPRGPEDLELRNIIDKLAQFVAKNGPEFEQMTKAKQKGNPRFSFLFGGDHYTYYQFRVTTEQAIARNQQSRMQPGLQPVNSPQIPFDIPPAAPSDNSNEKIQGLQQHLRDSEKNLLAQKDVLMQQQQAQIDEAVMRAERDNTLKLAQNAGLNLDDFGHCLDALAQSCTKEAIANGKQWIFNNCTTDRQREVILMYLLLRTKDASTTSDMRLHLLYLINDWAHHCARKKLQAITQMLDRYVPQLYSFSVALALDANSKDKLKKLMSLWENNKYFSDHVYKLLQGPEAVVATSRATTLAQYQNIANDVMERVNHTYKQYEGQHQEYARHIQQQIAGLKAQNVVQQHSLAQQQSQSKRRSRFDQTPQEAQAPPLTPPVTPIRPAYTEQQPNYPPSPQTMFSSGPPSYPPPFPPPQQWNNSSIPPPRAPWGPGTSGPPPMPGGHSKPLIRDLPDKGVNLKPSVMYYDLPAGLMVPLVKLEDTEYKPIKRDDLRLPPPIPPSERLINAVEMFFAPPSHDHPRDNDGWERLGLYEYYKAKGKAAHESGKKLGQEESDSDSSSSSGSRSPSPKPRRRQKHETPPPPTFAPQISAAPSGSMHQGLGAEGDAFDSFRRMKSGHFIDRMANKQEERLRKKEEETDY